MLPIEPYYFRHKYCSPSRSTYQSGRLPMHVNVVNADMSVLNSNDPISGFAGIPRNMTGLATQLKKAGYATHMVGKWDAGMATPDHSPEGRGYDTSFIYYHHANVRYVPSTIFSRSFLILTLHPLTRPLRITGLASMTQSVQRVRVLARTSRTCGIMATEHAERIIPGVARRPTRLQTANTRMKYSWRRSWPALRPMTHRLHSTFSGHPTSHTRLSKFQLPT